MNASIDLTDMTRTLGSFPMTYSADSGRWVSETLSVEIDGDEWGVSLDLVDGRVRVYMFSDAGADVHSAVTFSPVVSLLTALRGTLR